MHSSTARGQCTQTVAIEPIMSKEFSVICHSASMDSVLQFCELRTTAQFRVISLRSISSHLRKQ